MDGLQKFKLDVLELQFQNRLSNYYVKDCLIETITKIENKEKSTVTENIFLTGFEELEAMGWNIEDSDTVLSYWCRLGSILEIENVESKINQFDTAILDKKINQLRDLKNNKKINAEMKSTPHFYGEMRRLMNESIDHVIEQLNKSNNIDEMLLVFSKDLDKFINLKTDDFSFGDTEDRETVGEFYMEIMDIVGMKYSRGLLSDKLE